MYVWMDVWPETGGETRGGGDSGDSLHRKPLPMYLSIYLAIFEHRERGET